MDPFVEVIWKVMAAFIGILIFARLLGKQQMSQLNTYDYITGITFGNIAAAIALDAGEKTVLYLWALAIFTVLTLAFSILTEKSRPMRKLIEGEPVILVHNGKILEHNMSKARYSIDNLMMQLRERDVFNIQDVEFAIAETDGQLTVQKKSTRRPLNASDIGLNLPAEGLPSELIMDGEMIYQNLKQNNVDEAWLMNQLKNMGYNDMSRITYACIDSNGTLHIDEVRDDLKHTVDISD